MVTPVLPVPADIAAVLHLGMLDKHRQRMTCIGYWRSRAEGGGSPYHNMLDGYRAEVINPNPRGGTTNGLSHRDYAVQQIPGLERKVVAWDSLPWPGDHVDPNMPTEDRDRVARWLDSAPDLGGYMGYSSDRLAVPDENGRRPTNGTREHGCAGYCWPSGLSHYVRTYGLRLDPAFLDAIEHEYEAALQAESERATGWLLP